MGVACARRIGSGAKLVLAEIDGSKLKAVTQSLAYEGYDVTAVEMDVSDAAALLTSRSVLRHSARFQAWCGRIFTEPGQR